MYQINPSMDLRETKCVYMEYICMYVCDAISIIFKFYQSLMVASIDGVMLRLLFILYSLAKLLRCKEERFNVSKSSFYSYDETIWSCLYLTQKSSTETMLNSSDKKLFLILHIWSEDQFCSLTSILIRNINSHIHIQICRRTITPTPTPITNQ